MRDDEIDWANTTFSISPDKVWALYEIKRLRNELMEDAQIFDEIKMGKSIPRELTDREKAVMVNVFWQVGVMTGQIE